MLTTNAHLPRYCLSKNVCHLNFLPNTFQTSLRKTRQ
uniref:Uncharacterized protein n=1 Tax=Arundo donax TaxID=35708 RepID=A0A0A9BAM9_ARUDO